MDPNTRIYLMLALLVVVVIVGALLKRKARIAGAARAVRKQQRRGGEDGLGATLLLAADRATSESIVGPVLSAIKRVRRQDDGTWAHTNYNTDDVVYELVSVEGGTLVAVQRAIEFIRELHGMKHWARARQAITEAAQQRGIAVTEGSRPLAPAPGVEIEGAQVWLPVARVS